MAGAIFSSGCITMAAVGASANCGGCSNPRGMRIANHLDGIILDVLFGSGDFPQAHLHPSFRGRPRKFKKSPFVSDQRVSVEGVVTSSGTPLYQAKVDLSWGIQLWTVRTDGSGRYQIQGVVELDHCSDLHFTIRHPDGRTTDLLPVKCGEQQLDYDFPAPTHF